VIETRVFDRTAITEQPNGDRGLLGEEPTMQVTPTG
jgi:hypothetical protein